jgi:TIR domain
MYANQRMSVVRLEPTSRDLRIFLCHSSEDKPRVRELWHRLRSDGMDPWLDEKSLLPGQDWRLQITRAVRQSDIVIVCLSSTSIIKEGFVNKEITFALDLADEKPEGVLFIIPLRLDQCTVPDRLARWHWVNLFETDGYARLVESLRLRAVSITRKQTSDPPSSPVATNLSIEALPAVHGSCLLLRYEGAGDRQLIVVDGGGKETFATLRDRLQKLSIGTKKSLCSVDLVIGTHLQRVHLDGLLRLAKKPDEFRISRAYIHGLSLSGKHRKRFYAGINAVPENSFRYGVVLAERICNSLREGGRATLEDLETTREMILAGGLKVRILWPPSALREKIQHNIITLLSAPRQPLDADKAGKIESSLRELGSVVVLIDVGNEHKALLTSDADEESILCGLDNAGIMADPLDLSLLLLPDHGQNYMIHRLLQRVRAKHYLITGDRRNRSVQLTLSVLRRFQPPESVISFSDDRPTILL